MRTTPRAAVLACVLVAALPLAGCAQARPASRAALTGAAADLLTRSGGYYTDQASLTSAAAALTARCMARAGYSYPVAGAPAVTSDEPWRPDLAERRAHGYGFADPASESASPVDRYVATLSAANQAGFRRAMSGASPRLGTVRLWNGATFQYTATGCIGGAQAALYGDAATAAQAFYLPQDAYNVAYAQAQQDPASRAAVASWSRCMARSGYRYASPAAARSATQAAYRTLPKAAAQRQEIAVAVADGTCVRSVGLPRLMATLLVRYGSRLPAAARSALDAAARDTRAAVGRAQRSK